MGTETAGAGAKPRRWPAWGSLATGALAVLALATTLFVAHRALSEASDILVHGEADALVAVLVNELVEEPDPMAPAALEKVFRAHEAAGLRYLAVAEREIGPLGKPLLKASEEDPRVLAQVGSAELHGFHPPLDVSVVSLDGLRRTGKLTVSGRRVRVSGLLVAPVRGMRKVVAVMGSSASPSPQLPVLPERALDDPSTREAVHTAIQRSHVDTNGNRVETAIAVVHSGPPWLFAPIIVEFEPPVTATLRGHFDRLTIVAAVASAILLAFAIAWARSALRIARLEQRAAREQRLVALGGMSSVMAHEIRNPLASLKGHAQLLMEESESLDEAQKKKVSRVVAEAERLEVLTKNLLDFVRDGPIERTPVSPTALIEQILRDLPPERIRVDLAAAPDRLLVDEERIARAVQNLVDNALEAAGAASADEPKVDVRIARDAGDATAVVIEVRDRGPGLPKDQPIFDPFVTTRVRGTGLGLSIARRIAEQHEGTLTGETAAEGGALFRLRLPRAAGAATATSALGPGAT